MLHPRAPFIEILHLFSECKLLFTSFREIVQRVAEAMIVCGFYHPADAMLVRRQMKKSLSRSS